MDKNEKWMFCIVRTYLEARNVPFVVAHEHLTLMFRNEELLGDGRQIQTEMLKQLFTCHDDPGMFTVKWRTWLEVSESVMSRVARTPTTYDSAAYLNRLFAASALDELDLYVLPVNVNERINASEGGSEGE